MSVSRRILVAGVGNIFLSDDGFGSEVARQLSTAEHIPDGVQITDYGIRAMHLAYDLLLGWERLIMIDLLPSRGNPGSVHVVELDPASMTAGPTDPHGLVPHAVRSAVGQLGGALPPAVLVGCEPADVTEGFGLTELVKAAIPVAVDTVLRLVHESVPMDLTGRGR